MARIFLAFLLIVVALVAPQFIPDDPRDIARQSRRWTRNLVRGGAGALALLFMLSTAFVTIGADEVGHLKRIYGGGSMPAGQVIAGDGENGPQAEVLSAGFHFRLLLNVLYHVERFPLTEIPENQYGLLVAQDGRPLREGQFLADGWPEDQFSEMLMPSIS